MNDMGLSSSSCHLLSSLEMSSLTTFSWMNKVSPQRSGTQKGVWVPPAPDLESHVCPPFTGHAHLTDFNIATIIKDGERATALAGTKPYMGKPRASGDT